MSCRVCLQERELIGMLEQVQDRVADQPDRRLVSRDDQQHHGAEELLLAERVALVPGGQESADEIVRGSGAPLREEVGQVADELAHLLEEPLHVLRVERGRDDRVRPLLEAILIGRRHAEELRDHGDRQRERVVGRQIHRTARLDRVEQLVGDGLDPRPQLLDPLRREGLRHEPPQAPVVVAVAVQHVVLDHLQPRRHHPRRFDLLRRHGEPRDRARSARRRGEPRRRRRAA